MKLMKPSVTSYLAFFLFNISFIFSSVNIKNSTNSKENRKERVFSLFSVVQFPNDACASTSGTYSNGTCFTASECSSNGGSAQGNCAAGFGVCCVFSVSASNSRVNKNCTYIVNPSYPSNYAPTSTPNTVTYTINKSQADVCRIRLDYDTFVLTQPSQVAATQGQCLTDSMTLTTTSQTTVPSAGVYGNYPYLCGTNTGYHSYLDMSCTSTDTATITFTIGDTTDNQWKIKVTQMSCNDDCVASQAGCFQYHTGVTGTLQSYNFQGGSQISNQNYKNCIRQEEGHCCIQYTVIGYNIDATTCADAANRCAGGSTCSRDAILIPGTISGSNLNYDKFCGVNLNSEGTIAVNSPIITCDLPFELSHITGIVNVGDGTNAALEAEDGFSLTYTQLQGNC